MSLEFSGGSFHYSHMMTFLTKWFAFSMKNYWGWEVLSCTVSQGAHHTTPGVAIHTASPG